MDLFVDILLYACGYVTVMGCIWWHELGHYLAFRRYGVTPESLNVGLGPRLYRRTLRSGTEFTFRLLPLGGWVMATKEVRGDGSNAVVYAAGLAFNVMMALAGTFYICILSVEPLMVLNFMTEPLWDVLRSVVRFVTFDLVTLVQMEESSFHSSIVSNGLHEGFAGGVTVLFKIWLLFGVWVHLLMIGLNILPIPPFDGGKLAMLAVKQWVPAHRWKQLEGVLLGSGLCLVLALIGYDLVSSVWNRF